MAKKQPPNFNEGWAYFPGASKFEIKIDASGHYSPATVRQFGNKKIVQPDENGIVRLYDDEKQLREFNPKEVLKEMLEKKPAPPVVAVEKKKEQPISADEGFPSMNVNEEIQQLNSTIQTKTTDTMKTTKSKGKGKTTPTPKKTATPAKAKQRTGLPNRDELKVTKEEEKIAKLKTQYTIKVWKLHKLGRTPKEIMVICNKPDKETSTPMAIERYKANKNLQAKADAVKVD